MTIREIELNRAVRTEPNANLARIEYIDQCTFERHERFKREFREKRRRLLRGANRRWRRTNGLSLRHA